MKAQEYPFAQELITDTVGNVRKVILDFNDYQRLLEILEDEGLYQAMIAIENQEPLSLDQALEELEKE